MSSWLGGLLDRLAAAPEVLFYLVLVLAAALENVVPPVPADVVVLFGGLLVGRAGADVFAVFLAVWLSNVIGALLVYAAGRRYGPTFFEGRLGRFLLRPRQLERLNAVYRRYGFGVIFISRFLPMFRAVVPVFAGVARIGFWRTAIPLSIASAIWYGGLVYAGSIAGRNFAALAERFEAGGRWLWLVAAAVALGVGVWWWRTRSIDTE